MLSGEFGISGCAAEVNARRCPGRGSRPCWTATLCPGPGSVWRSGAELETFKQKSRIVGAAKLADVPVGESPAGGDYPVDTVVISRGGEGDRTVESLEVKVSEKGGEQLDRS